MIGCMVKRRFFFFFFNDTATTEIYTLTLHDALPISIKEGDAQIVIGTHALIQRGVEFRDLSLVVVDEQHRFGVSQRTLFKEKGRAMPDTLVMTATPIPRTLSLTLYGDLEVSIIDELPPGRQPVDTRVVDLAERPGAYEAVREELESGRQAYVICPLVEESEALEDVRAADRKSVV